MTGRRAFLAAALVAPVAVACAGSTHADALTYDPVPEYLAACRTYDEHDPVSVARHDAAHRALLEWEPATPTDMLRKIVARLDPDIAAPETSPKALIRQVDQLVADVA